MRHSSIYFVFALIVISAGALIHTAPVASATSLAGKGNADQVVASSSPSRLSGSLHDRNSLFQQIRAAKIAEEVLRDTADGQTASVVIFLADQADVSAAYDMLDQDARGWFVYKTLTEHANRT